jgi:hypothetical protein
MSGRLPLGFALFSACSVLTLLAPHAGAQAAGPPPDAEALVKGPTAPPPAPAKEEPLDSTTATLSAGGMLTTGNARLFALTGSGAYETRFSDNGIGFSLLGNYGEGAPPGEPLETSAQSVQGRVRYDRYLVDRLSLFLINTGRHDRFQGLDFRYNLDPGVKYLLVEQPATKLWVEAGYDFQFDLRRNEARTVLDGDGNPVLDPATGLPQRLDKTETDHSARLFVGHSHAFNDAVTLSAGVEYLQSFVESERSRLNFDALFAAKVAGGLAVGFGFNARYDNAPLPEKHELDTTSTLTLIYSFSNAAPPAAPTCPCPPPPPPAPEPVVAPPEPLPAPATPPVAAPPPDAPPPVAEPAPAAPSSEPGPVAPGAAPAPGVAPAPGAAVPAPAR